MARYSNSVTLDDTGVVPGSYVNASFTVNSKGQIIVASNGDTGGGLDGSLDDLFDVSTSTAAPGQILQFTGSVWTNVTLNLTLLDDVTIATPTAGHVLYYTGNEWVNGAPSDNNLLTSSDLGVSTQAQNDNLQTVADLVGTPGLLAFNGTDVVKVVLQASSNMGLAVTNGNGSFSPMTVGLDLTNLPTNVGISVDDEIVFNDVSAGIPTKAKISDIISAGGAITDGVTLGSGADVFIIAQGGIAQFRGILSNSAGIVISTDEDDVLVGLSDSLSSLATVAPTAGNFLVGDGTQWASKTTAEVKTTLGFGTMADEDAADYLALAGGVMAGQLDLGGNVLTGLLMPTANDDAASKAYVDTQVASGVDAGNGLTKTGNTIDIVAADASITVNADSIQLNTAFTDNLYYTKTELNSTVSTTEGADLVGTSIKPSLGGATTVEEALAYINNFFANSIPKFSLDLSAIWNYDVGTPNVLNDIVNDTKVASFDPDGDSAIYVDFVIPLNYIPSDPMTFYANVAKSGSGIGEARMALSYKYERPNVARGVAPNGVFVNDDAIGIANTDDLLHIFTWTIPANTFQPLDVVTLRFSRLGSDSLDTYTGNIYLFSTLIAQ